MLRYFIKLFIIYQFFGSIDARSNSPEDIIFQFYGLGVKTIRDDIPITNPTRLLTSPGFVLTKRTLFYWFGWREYSSNASAQAILDGYLARGDYNIVIVDWSNMNQGNYLFDTVFQRVLPAAIAFSISLGNLIKIGLNENRYHIVGFGVGAHVSLLAGDYLKRNFNYVAPRITMLDPPQFGFWSFMPTRGDKNNVKFVDCIHTDAGSLGSRTSFGHANFWPNKGKLQPGCPSFRIPYLIPSYSSASGQCSHRRAWAYYAESLTKPKNFASRLCNIFRNPDSFSQTIVYMGLETDLLARGHYCLRTQSTSPYGLGEQGSQAK